MLPIMKRVVLGLERRGLLNWLPDKQYLELMYSAAMGKKLNLKKPQTFNEKLQWLKLYNRKPEYSIMVDKYLVREYIKDKIGEEYLIPLLGVWDNPDDIDFDALPKRFVLKCNHNSGKGMYICKDKSLMNEDQVVSDLRAGLNQNYYLRGREWPYKNVKPRILAETYMEDKILGELRDYKFFCFGGKVKCFKIDYDRFSEHRANYYTPRGELLKFGEAVFPPNFEREISFPAKLEKMIELAEKLSLDHPFLRVDFYEVNDRIFFGELTFFPASGFGSFVPEEWDLILGEWINLPEGKKE